MPEPTDTTPPKDDAPRPTPPKGGEPDAQRDADEGRGGKGTILAELAAERDQRQALQQQVNDLLPLRQQMDALRGVFGDKGADSGEDIVTTLQKQVNAMQRDNLVNTVARRHGITDDDDLELLRGIPDETAMARLAQRLKAATTAPPTLEPDRAQGAQSPAKSAEDAQYEAFYPTHS